MLKRVKLLRFKGFQDYEMRFREENILVGKNNAGKSTIVDALRIVSHAVKKSTRVVYEPIPRELNLPFETFGIRIKLDELKIDQQTITYWYEDQPAEIIADFDNKVRIHIYITQDYAVAVIYDSSGQFVTNKGKAVKVGIKRIGICPILSPIKEKEKILKRETIIEDLDTYLASRHFRNEVYHLREGLFEKFKSMAEQTWPDIIVETIEYKPVISNHLSLFIVDNSFTAEIGVLGSGIQMWLQTIWFLCRCIVDHVDTVILDEPDIYMHPEIQIRVLNLIRNLGFKQYIITTHSVEIISDVDYRSIGIINKAQKKMEFAKDWKILHDVARDIGSSVNMALVKMGNANKCLYVEGDDDKLLKRLFEVLYPGKSSPLYTIPIIPLNGAANLSQTYGVARFLRQETEGLITCHALIDRDYLFDSEVDELLKKASSEDVRLHVWNRKEIENYLIVPSAMHRLIRNKSITLAEFECRLSDYIDANYKNDIIDTYATKIQDFYRNNPTTPRMTAGNAHKDARTYIEDRWTNLNDKIKLLPGKEFIQSMVIYMHETYDTQFSISKLLKVMKKDEIDVEVRIFLDSLQ